MKWISFALAAAVLTVAGEAAAFDESRDSSARVYFSLPLGGSDASDAAPAFGLRLATGIEDAEAGPTMLDRYSGNDTDTAGFLETLGGSVDWRFGWDGRTDFAINGLGVAGTAGRLNASDEEMDEEEQRIWEEYTVPIIGIGVGVGLFVVGKTLN